MGRPKGFSREEVLEKTAQLFWRRGFAETTIQDLEKATGVNKSGLYAEFKDKDDLFVASLKHYASKSSAERLLSAEPLGWSNIEAFLNSGDEGEGQKGCFLVNTVREIPNLPTSVRNFVKDQIREMKRLLVRNIQAANPRLEAQTVAAIVTNFNAGLCLEQNMGSASALSERVSQFMRMLKAL